MPRSEIKYFPISPFVRAAASENFSAFKPAHEDQFIRCWNIKVFSIHFFCAEVRYILQYLPAIGWLGSTTQSLSFSSASRHFKSQLVPINFLKIFEKWPECRTIKPHTIQDRFPPLYPRFHPKLHHGQYAPTILRHPFFQYFIRQPVHFFIQCCSLCIKPFFVLKKLLDCPMNTFRINSSDYWIFLFMSIFIPYCNMYHLYISYIFRVS